MVHAGASQLTQHAAADATLSDSQRRLLEAVRAEFATGTFFYAEGRLDIACRLTEQATVNLSAGATRASELWPYMWNLTAWQELVVQGVAPDKWLVSVIRGHVAVASTYVDNRTFTLAVIARLAATGARSPWQGPGALDAGPWPATVVEVEQAIATDEATTSTANYMALPAVGLHASKVRD